MLYLSDVYFPRVNGVSTSIATFRAAFARLGVGTALVAPGYGERGTEPSEEERAADERLGIARVAGRRPPFDPEDRFVTARAIERAALALGRFDLVHVQTPFSAHRAGVRLARRWRVPVVETYHTDFEHYVEPYLPWLPAAAGRAFARRFARRRGSEVDLLLVPSTAMREVLAGYRVAAPIEVLPTGLPPAAFRRGDGARFRSRLGVSEDTPLCVHVGRLGHEKNLRFLLDAFARLRRERPAARLLVAGEGPARADLEARALEADLAGAVRFLGYLDRDRELADCYRAGDLFLFASKTETQGLVLLEAMAQGVPVVALAEQGTRDLLAAGRGAVVPEESVEAYAAACAALLDDAPRRERLGREARALARGWSAAAFAERLLAHYGRLCADASTTASASSRPSGRR